MTTVADYTLWYHHPAAEGEKLSFEDVVREEATAQRIEYLPGGIEVERFEHGDEAGTEKVTFVPYSNLELLQRGDWRSIRE